jgi:hypothetical protein
MSFYLFLVSAVIALQTDTAADVKVLNQNSGDFDMELDNRNLHL